MELTPLTRKIVHLDLKATLVGGGEATNLAPAEVAVVPHRHDVKASTVWRAVDNWNAEELSGTVLVLGFEVVGAEGLQIPSAGGDLYARIRDTPEDDPAFIERIVYG